MEVEEGRVARSWWELMRMTTRSREKWGGREKRIGMQERKEEGGDWRRERKG